MNYFYHQNIMAVFFGDGKITRKKARSLHLKYDINSIVFDDKPRFLTRLHPFIKTFPTDRAAEDEFLLDLIESVIEKNIGFTFLMFINSQKFAELTQRNESFFQSRFIVHPELVLNDL